MGIDCCNSDHCNYGNDSGAVSMSEITELVVRISANDVKMFIEERLRALCWLLLSLWFITIAACSVLLYVCLTK